MLKVFLTKFWPALIPIILYVMWIVIRRKRRGADAPYDWTTGPWGWAVITSLAIMIFIFIILGLSAHRTDGDYVPPHMENGKLVDGALE